MTSTRSGLATLALLLLVAGTHVVRAQTDPLASALAHRVQVLEGRLARRPTPRDRCELGAVYLRQERQAEAGATLDQGIREFGAPTSALDRRTLAACLSSRGHAFEAASDVEHARVAYERSLELRDDRATRERVEALVLSPYPAAHTRPRAISALPADEAAAASEHSMARRDDGTALVETIARPSHPGDVTWSLVAWESELGGISRGVSAVACTASGCAADEVDGDTTLGGNGGASIRSFLVHEGAPSVLEVRMQRDATESDGEGDVPTVDETTLHLCGRLERSVRCVEIPVQDRLTRVIYDATFTEGHLVLHRVSGRAPASQPIPLDRPLTFAELVAAIDG